MNVPAYINTLIIFILIKQWNCDKFELSSYILFFVFVFGYFVITLPNQHKFIEDF